MRRRTATIFLAGVVCSACLAAKPGAKAPAASRGKAATPAKASDATLAVAGGETALLWVAAPAAEAPTMRPGTWTSGRLKIDPRYTTVARPGSRLIAVHVRVPRGQAPGVYSNRLVSSTKPGVAIPLSLRVLPFDLIGSSRGYAYVGSQLWRPDQAAASLASLKEMGFLRFGVRVPRAQLMDALALCREHRVREPILFRPVEADLLAQAADVETERREKQLPAVQWLLTPEQWGEAGSMTASGVSCGVIADSDAEMPASPPSTQIVSADRVLDPSAAKSPATAPASGASGLVLRWWTWDPEQASEAKNRLLAGFLLWRAGLAGAYLEEPEAETSSDPIASAKRREALRAGIIDSRYVTTLYSLTRQVKDKDRRNPLPGQAEAALAQALGRLKPDSPMSAVDATRRLIRDWILKLRAVV
jgi:hypothetical protein